MENTENKDITAVPYFTEKGNVFLAPEGLSDQEYERISRETDLHKENEKTEKLIQTKSVPYVTDRGNIFIASEGITPEEFDQNAYETDLVALQEKKEALSFDEEDTFEYKKKILRQEKEIDKEIQRLKDEYLLKNERMEIERKAVFEQSESLAVKEDYLFRYKTGNFQNVLVLDLETTGFSARKDEILQVSCMDLKGNALIDSYVKPDHHTQWKEAEAKNGITPQMVADAPSFAEMKEEIQLLINKADLIITYNGQFDMTFLQSKGIKVNPSIPHLDVMKSYASRYGVDTDLPGGKKWGKLTEAAQRFNINFTAHNSLEDVRATLQVAKRIYGENLENLTLKEVEENTISKALPRGEDRKSKEYWKMVKSVGNAGLSDPDLLSDFMKNSGNQWDKRLLENYTSHPEDSKLRNRLVNALGRYELERNPDLASEFFRHQEETKIASEVNASKENRDVLSGQMILPSFSVMTEKGQRVYENMKVQTFIESEAVYLLYNGREALKVAPDTFQSILKPSSSTPVQSAPLEVEKALDVPAVVAKSTVIPEFALLTAQGLKTYKNLTLEHYNEREGSYTLTDGESSLTVTKDTFAEITSPERFERVYTKDTPEYEKLPKTSYDQYFRQRDNCADNFMHNFAVYCRKEANSPIDALNIAKKLVDLMPKEEKIKTREQLRQLAQDDRDINTFLVAQYLEAVKDFPLDKELIQDQFKSNVIARPFYDTVSTPGQRIDPSANLKVGDMVHDLAFNLPDVGGKGKQTIYESLTVVSSSKEGNNVILMDKDRSFYEVPRDTLLEGYNRQQEKQQKTERKMQKWNRIDIGYER